jgi:RNA polymerase sigma-70 factor (ECF subfamily)
MMHSYCPRSASPEPVVPPAPYSREWEALLIERTLDGRSDAFGDLVQPHLTHLTRFARMRLRNASEAEDAVQRSVLRAFRHLAAFRGEASFKTWLSTITWNEVSQARRRQTAHRLGSLQESLTANLADPSGSPHSLAQSREERDRLYGALARLPEKYRRIIQMRDLAELSVVETAQRLSLTAAAVKTRHHRARKLLTRSFDRREVRPLLHFDGSFAGLASRAV